MKTTEQNFLDLLVMNGHDGDTMCLHTIEAKLSKGLTTAVSHYANYLSDAKVKKMTPAEITKAVKLGAVIWTVEGIITKSKLNVPMMNGVLLLNENMVNLCRSQVIIL